MQRKEYSQEYFSLELREASERAEQVRRVYNQRVTASTTIYTLRQLYICIYIYT